MAEQKTPDLAILENEPGIPLRSRRAADTELLETLRLENTQLRERLAAAELRLARQPQIDPGTRLPNKMLFYDRLGQAVARVRRHKKLMALVYLELSYSRIVTAKFGASAKRALSEDFIARITSSIRDVDTFAQLGEKSFSIILEDVQSPGVVDRIITKLNKNMERDFKVQGHDVAVSLYIGVALYDDDLYEGADVIADAKANIQDAKTKKVFRVNWWKSET
jgi:diguanylate cyclase (GGDEF)-like protein